MSIYSFITKPFRYNVQQDSAVKTAYDLAREVELNTAISSMADAATVNAELFNILKSQRYRFDVPVIGTDVISLGMFDGVPPCAWLLSDRFGTDLTPFLTEDGNSAAEWSSAYGGVLSSVGGRIRITTPTPAIGSSFAYQGFSTVPGARYGFSINLYRGTSPYTHLWFGSNTEWADVWNGNGAQAFVDALVTGEFNAVDDQTIVHVGVGGGVGDNQYAEFDNLSIWKITPSKLVVIPDFTIDLAAGQTVLRCWG